MTYHAGPWEPQPRLCTIPARRREPFRWAPVAWVGGVAAAFLVVAFGVTQLHGPAATTATTSAGIGRAAAPSPPGCGVLDQGGTATSLRASPNSTNVIHPHKYAPKLS